MGLVVQKYGGTSVGDLSCIEQVAEKVHATFRAGHQVVVVLSAMAGETNRLEQLAHKLAPLPNRRELDSLLSTGEQVAVALLSIALLARGCVAKSFTGAQAGILTDSEHTKAQIKQINPQALMADLEAGRVVVVTGFQGMDAQGNITTLGRGGSDTTAVALAAALKADECQIYTDVVGVFTADPKKVPDARCMDTVSFAEMLELSSLGAKVLQMSSVAYADKFKLPLRVLSTFNPGPGTLITHTPTDFPTQRISGITYTVDEARIVVRHIPDSPGCAGRLLAPISAANIEVDMVVQNSAEVGRTDLTFTVAKKHYRYALEIIQPAATELGAKQVFAEPGVAKLSLVGVGLQSHAHIASTMFRLLGQEGVNIQLITTSDIKVTVILDEKYLEIGILALHKGFELHKEPEKRGLTQQQYQCAI